MSSPAGAPRAPPGTAAPQDFSPIVSALHPILACAIDARTAQDVYAAYIRLQDLRAVAPARQRGALAPTGRGRSKSGLRPPEWGSDAWFLLQSSGVAVRPEDAVQRLCQLDTWPAQTTLQPHPSNGAIPCHWGWDQRILHGQLARQLVRQLMSQHDGCSCQMICACCNMSAHARQQTIYSQATAAVSVPTVSAHPTYLSEWRVLGLCAVTQPATTLMPGHAMLLWDAQHVGPPFETCGGCSCLCN